MKLTFFDFTYYFISKIYSKAGEKGHQFSATAILSGSLTMNVFTVLEIFALYFQSHNFFLSKILLIFIYLLFQICFYIRYLRNTNYSLDKIETEWKTKLDKTKIKYRFFCLLYVVLSIIIPIGLAIYIGSLDF
jgi:Ca2+/Na+ antiporter